MTYRPDLSSERSRMTQPRPRLPDAKASTRLFQGWGPTV